MELYFPLPPFPIRFPFPFSSPLEVQLQGLGEHCKLPQLALGQSPSENWIGAFWPWNLTSGGTSFTNFPRELLTNVNAFFLI